jgi:hypothetical protein
VKREADGTYWRFFSVHPTNATFLYREMSVQPTLQVIGRLPANFHEPVRFPFGCCIQCKGEITKYRESLTDQAAKTDGRPGPQEWHANSDSVCCTSESFDENGISTKDNTVIGQPVKKVKKDTVYFSLADAHKSSWSAMCAVFHDTYIGVLVGCHWEHVKGV